MQTTRDDRFFSFPSHLFFSSPAVFALSLLSIYTLSASSNSKRERLFPRAAPCVYLATFPTAPQHRAIEKARRRQNSRGRLTPLIRSQTQNIQHCRPRQQACMLHLQAEAIMTVRSPGNGFIAQRLRWRNYKRRGNRREETGGQEEKG